MTESTDRMFDTGCNPQSILDRQFQTKCKADYGVVCRKHMLELFSLAITGEIYLAMLGDQLMP